MRIIRFGKKKIKLLTKNQQDSYENAKSFYLCKNIFENKYLKDKRYCKVRDHCHYTEKYRGTEHSICNLISNKNLIKHHFLFMHFVNV